MNGACILAQVHETLLAFSHRLRCKGANAPRTHQALRLTIVSQGLRKASVMRALWVNESAIRATINAVERSTKIFVYPSTHIVVDRAARIFLDRLLRLRTHDWKQANVFYIPSWEALPNASRHEAFLTSGAARNHFLFHITGDPAKCSPLSVRKAVGVDRLDEKIQFIEFGGRHDCGGVCYTQLACCHGCFSGLDSIVVPPVVPEAMYRAYEPTRRRRALRSMDMDYELSTRNLQTERAYVVRYFEMARLNLSREYYRSHLMPLVSRSAARYETFMGVHAAGFGIWSARLFAYIIAGAIPMFFTDGVVLPFERVIRYEAFAVKLAMARAINLDYEPLRKIEVIERARMDSLLARRRDWFDAVLDNMRVAAPWIDWNSRDELRNPGTLALIEMWCRGVRLKVSAPTLDLCAFPSSRIAFRETWPVAF